ncbi:MAG: biotin--[acetyl-CoA-carboxylase] ligase [Planctomycetota bacterium]|nr:biotin--[acetyl-CoA-carboxylase] ligase [Planctomycetota bacterium]
MLSSTPWQRLLLQQTTSTQHEGRRLCTAEAGVRRAIRAVQQTEGHGRRGSHWVSPAGGLWCTLTIPAPHGADPFDNLLIALAAREAVAGLLGPGQSGLAMKWPNDLIHQGRKWGGVIAELHGPADQQEILFGIGLNLQIEAESLRQHREIPDETTSILSEFGHSPSPEEVLESILFHVDRLLEEDRSMGGRERSRLQLSEVLDTLGRRIRWNGPGDRTGEGEAIGLTTDGALIVDQDTPAPRQRCQLRSARISHVRTRNGR